MASTIDIKGQKGANTQSDEFIQLVSFLVEKEEFGLDIHRVQEINLMVDITRVPNSPPFVTGVINLRGKVIPIIDLRKRFGFPPKENDKDTRIIVVELGGIVVGFIVDAVREVIRIPKNILEPPPTIITGIGSEYITAVAKMENRLLIILELEKILHDNEKKQIESVA